MLRYDFGYVVSGVSNDCSAYVWKVKQSTKTAHPKYLNLEQNRYDTLKSLERCSLSRDSSGFLHAFCASVMGTRVRVCNKYSCGNLNISIHLWGPRLKMRGATPRLLPHPPLFSECKGSSGNRDRWCHGWLSVVSRYYSVNGIWWSSSDMRGYLLVHALVMN